MDAAAIDHLAWLTRWYAGECNGDWEHSYGVTIGTLDNPGWTVSVDLFETNLFGRPFAPVRHNTDASQDGGDARWYHCRVEGARFRGEGGANDLPTVIGIFRAWVEGQSA